MPELLRYSPVTLLPKPVENEVVRKTVGLMLNGARRRPQSAAPAEAREKRIRAREIGSGKRTTD